MTSHILICEYCGAAHTAERSDKRFCSDAHRVHAYRLRTGQRLPGRWRRSSQDITSAEREALDLAYLERVHGATQLGLLEPEIKPARRRRR